MSSQSEHTHNKVLAHLQISWAGGKAGFAVARLRNLGGGGGPWHSKSDWAPKNNGLMVVSCTNVRYLNVQVEYIKHTLQNLSTC